MPSTLAQMTKMVYPYLSPIGKEVIISINISIDLTLT